MGNNKPIQKERIRRSKKLITVNDILASDEVTDILEALVKNKSRIKHLIVIVEEHDRVIHHAVTETTSPELALYLLEDFKFEILHDIKNNDEEVDDAE